MSALIELSRNQIDEVKWNELIKNSKNGLIYHSIPFLDALSKNWSTVILGNYEYALPLTFKSFLGSTLLQQPPFIQQLGIIGNNISNEIMNLFIEYVSDKFDFIHYAFNFNNPTPNLIKKKNFTLDLHQSYDQISKYFNADAHANIKKANKNAFRYRVNDDPKKIITQFKNQYGIRFRHVKSTDYNNLIDFCFKHNDNWLSREVYLDKELYASCLLLKDFKRLYFHINYVSGNGRTNEANYFLLDNLIREFAESSYLLDFEGSDLIGVGTFYQKFGAINQPYYTLSINKLPFYLKLFKK